MDYDSLGLKVGLEIHQQLDTHKLFCNCESELSDSESKEFVRLLRPTQSEMGEVDGAALSEAKKKLKFRYQAPPSVCLVEADEEPPHDANSEALDSALEFAIMVGAQIVDEVQFMRKIVIDGSNTAGFQRTALIATGGTMTMGDHSTQGLEKINILSICLEEDAARKVEKRGSEVIYRLDRLGIPLIEIATEPEIRTPEQARAVAERIGSLLRATGSVKRGIGTIREDLNISISEGARVELKGVQELKMISSYVEEEVFRQRWLLAAKKELAKRGITKTVDFESKDLTHLFQNTGSKIIRSMLEKGGLVHAIKLTGYAQLLGAQLIDEVEKDVPQKQYLEERRILGPELASYIKPLGINGLFHSDELPGYGISEEEVQNVRKELSMVDNDAFVLIAEKEAKAHEAGKVVIARALAALVGVPEETRDPMSDGTSRYSRPLPGKARMYPETDVPPVRITKERLENIRANLPEMPEEKMKRFEKEYKLHPEQVKQLLSIGYDELFESLLLKHQSKGMQGILVRVLLSSIPELGSKGIDVTKVNQEMLDSVLGAVEAGEFAKEGIFSVIEYMITNDAQIENAVAYLGLSGVGQDELNKVIDEIIKDKMDFIKEKGEDAVGPLMGVVMKELRGKVDGKKVNEALRKKIKELGN
jgi:glutamyl-tRNA(Gln) amidotransferase subunit E